MKGHHFSHKGWDLNSARVELQLFLCNGQFLTVFIMWTEAGNGAFFISSKPRLCTLNHIVHTGAVNILPQERGASVLHRLNLRNETSQENESNINRKPVKSRNSLSYNFFATKILSSIGESAHITHSAQWRTNVRKSLIICSMTWRETSCGYHRIPSTVPSWPDTIMTPNHKFRSSCSAFVNLHLLLHPVNMPPCNLHGLALSYFSWVRKWSMLGTVAP